MKNIDHDINNFMLESRTELVSDNLVRKADEK